MTTEAESPTRTNAPNPLEPSLRHAMRAAPVAGGRRDDAYRRDIDGLRAIAVLSVLVFHAFPAALPGGFVGVDVFFVISGFLITGVIRGGLARGRFTFADFYARRIRRILPALIVVLAACYAFGWFALLPEEYRQLSKHIAAGMAFVSNFALWNEAGYFDASASAKPLLHLWSLGIEEQFYLVWPLALWWFARRRLRAWWLVVAVGAISFAINVVTVHKWPVAAFYSPLTRFWELQLGCFLALSTEVLEPRWSPMPRIVADAVSIAGAVAIGISVALLGAKLDYPGWWALLPTGGTFLLIASGPDGWFNRKVLSRTALVGIGLVSYPLYLWHWPMLSFASIIAIGTPSASVRAAIVIASIVLAAGTYVVVEKPIRFGSRKRFKVPALALLSFVIGVIGLGTYERSGVPERFPPEVRSLADFQYEFKTDARYPDCWLSGEQPADAFAPACIDTSAGRDLAVLWGDSHAARLYPGLKEAFHDTLALSQFTRDACPPILDVATPLCRKSNAWVFDQITRIKPGTVILFAAWTHYLVDWGVPSAGKTALLATIDALRNVGIRKIVVIGPAPVWKGGLPKLAYQAWKRSPFHTVPERLETGLDPAVPVADRQLERELASRQVTYFSLMDFFCTDAGCLTHLPESETRLVSWDAAHLTTDAAVLVAHKLAADGVLP